jgi:tRNA 2-thiocytidine biosynthesis protein TtcA
MPTTDEQRLSRCAGRLLGKLRRTSRKWPVLVEGSHVVVAVSGGLDSLAMAFLLTEHNRRLKTPLRLTAVHVRLDADGRTGGLRPPITDWLGGLGLEAIEVLPRLDAVEEGGLDCFACARARRRTLLETAEQLNSNVVALGHHADDVVETWLLALCYTGTGETMPPVRSYFDGAVTIVRPLYELRKGELRRLARLAAIPEPMAACGREAEARRTTIREALAGFGRDQNLVRRQLFWAAVRQLDEAPVGEESEDPSSF